MSVKGLSCITCDTNTSTSVVNTALSDLAPGSEGLLITLKSGSFMRTFRSEQLLMLSCNASGDTVDWIGLHGQGNSISTIEWNNRTQDQLLPQEKLYILDQVKKYLSVSHIAIAESISIAEGAGIRIVIVWKQPVMTFELQILDTELRNNLNLSKIADMSSQTLGPSVVYSELYTPPMISAISATTDRAPPLILANARFTS